MKFIIKFFPEITIKSKPVRRLLVKQLRTNLRMLMKAVEADIVVQKYWDKIEISTASGDEQVRQHIVNILSCVPGIAHFLDVMEYPFKDKQDTFEKTKELWGKRLKNKTFVVRCKRVGEHDFNSHELERFIGGGLHQHCENNGVDLHNPDVVVRIELREERLFIINQRHKGLGGFPLGSVDPVLSLLSGGFDSTVASYLMMKRGMRTHFCFFNLGGREHEIGVKEIALYLWMKYGSTSRVKFISVPFEGVVSEILKNVNDAQMGVILKRMMLRGASTIAEKLNVDALVTGEAVGQVSSQTLVNLKVIDSVTPALVLRPLIVTNKEDIIQISRDIGAEQFSAVMPEYCGVISVKPTTRAKPERIEHEESKFDFTVLDKAINESVMVNIDEIANEELSSEAVEEISVPISESIVIDVRHPSEEEQKPLVLSRIQVEKIPFYELHGKFSTLNTSKMYLLYCEKGVMSKLHAAHLIELGYKNVKVYRPT